MDRDQYLKRLLQLEKPSAAHLVQLGEWVEGEALPWLWLEAGGAILRPKRKHRMAKSAPAQQRLRPLSDADAVRNGLIVSDGDRKKMGKPSFYQAQLTMLDKEARRYCSRINEFACREGPNYWHSIEEYVASNAECRREGLGKTGGYSADAFGGGIDDFLDKTGSPYVGAFVFTVHGALLEMMHLALTLLEDAAREITDVPEYFSAWRRHYEEPFEVFKGSEQIIYGTFSGLTHTDRAPYTPIAALRTAIELRLRGAFGITSFVDSSRPNFSKPIDMNTIFEATRTKQKEIHFLVDFHDVWKIYRWSNFYLHGGARGFPWMPGFLIQYLRPLFTGPPSELHSAWSIHGGIQMKRATWYSVRSAIVHRSAKTGLLNRLSDAWRQLRAADKCQLELPSVDEKCARCVFLD